MPIHWFFAKYYELEVEIDGHCHGSEIVDDCLWAECYANTEKNELNWNP